MPTNRWMSRSGGSGFRQPLALRQQLGYTDPTDAARLIFSEADGLSGLIVDRYGTDLVVQLTAKAIAVRIDEIVPLLVELACPRQYCRAKRSGVGED